MKHKIYTNAKKAFPLVSLALMPAFAFADTFTVDYTSMIDAVKGAATGLITAVTAIGGVVIAVAVGIAGVGVIKRIANKV